ncbi:MAG: Gfo/Idh/MocA family oxidoreductase [candidate division KSB1 bacterium]|nr:Gfo/Idh/MocA family oxidoreductase [candidate division KSB1 bacterium]
MEKTEFDSSKPSRRSFLKGAAVGAAAFTIVPSTVFGQKKGKGKKAPSDRLNIAAVGVGGMGQNNVRACETENIVALCDVDEVYAGEVFKKYPQAKIYRDYRVMLEKQKDIDAVIVATPDHTHAVIAMAAMQLGKHVYVQKPLTHSVYEARKLTEAARYYKVVTQMGNQGHSGDGVRQICEWIWDGAIGDVYEVHAWTNRPVWPQGIEVDRPSEVYEVPPTLDWDLWVGPAPMRPYHPTYLAGKWRGWWDFGTGSLGDMGCHILDPVVAALKLKYPVSVEGNISTYFEKFFEPVTPKNEMYPRSSIIRFKYPARDGMPEVNVTWYDGGMMPPRPEELEQGRKMGDDDGGVIFVGTKGKLMCGCYAKGPRLIPETAMQAYKRPDPYLPRIPGGENGHEQDWIRACKGGEPACSNFDYAGPLTEMVLMGNLAVRFPYERLLWDGENMQVLNNDEANAYVKREYREGWTL